MLSNVKKKDVPLIAISLAAIVFIAATLSLFPQQTAQAADSIFNGVTRLLGSTVQVLVLLALGLVLYLATSKYGNIRLGEGKVEYSTLSWLFMFICAGLGSSTLYGLITTRPRALTLPRNRRKRWNTASLTLSSTGA